MISPYLMGPLKCLRVEVKGRKKNEIYYILYFNLNMNGPRWNGNKMNWRNHNIWIWVPALMNAMLLKHTATPYLSFSNSEMVMQMPHWQIMHVEVLCDYSVIKLVAMFFPNVPRFPGHPILRFSSIQTYYFKSSWYEKPSIWRSWGNPENYQNVPGFLELLISPGENRPTNALIIVLLAYVPGFYSKTRIYFHLSSYFLLIPLNTRVSSHEMLRKECVYFSLVEYFWDV